jgi:hypothetical protein
MLVLGASSRPERYSNQACKLLLEHNFHLYALGAKDEQADGFAIHQAWPKTGEVDTLTMYLNPDRQKQFYANILSLNPRRVIFNPGSENPECQATLEEKGILCEEACTLVLLHTGQF